MSKKNDFSLPPLPHLQASTTQCHCKTTPAQSFSLRGRVEHVSSVQAKLFRRLPGELVSFISDFEYWHRWYQHSLGASERKTEWGWFAFAPDNLQNHRQRPVCLGTFRNQLMGFQEERRVEHSSGFPEALFSVWPDLELLQGIKVIWMPGGH